MGVFWDAEIGGEMSQLYKELQVQRPNHTSQDFLEECCGQRACVPYIKPVNQLKLQITIEAIVYAGNGRSPHQNHDTQVVKLIADFPYFGAMVCDYMEPVVGCIGIEFYRR